MERDSNVIPPRTCVCGNKISSVDSHAECVACLGLQHAQAALASPGSCEHCARFSLKSLKRRLARQASLTGKDPMVGTAMFPREDSADGLQRVFPLEGASWGDQLDVVSPLVDEVDASLAAEPCTAADDDSDSGDEFLGLISEEEEGGEDGEPFTPYTQSAKPVASESECSGTDGSPHPTASMDLHDVCKRAAEKLGIPWPDVCRETTTSRYEGKRLPRAKCSARQLLPVFPECLEEATRSWSNPFSAKNPVQGGSALDWVDMESSGFSHLPPVEPLVASHLHPSRKPTITQAGPSLPSKADCLQSSMTEKCYKAVATSVRAMNASSLLMAYQAELEEELTSAPSATVWEEVCVVTDLCLRLHRCAVQASGRAMALMVSQERARWLNLSSLSLKEKTQLLDVPVDPKGLFGPAVATMQKRCEEKKREGEALQLCLPRKSQPTPPPPHRQSFAQAAARPPAFRIPKRQPPPQAGSQGQSKATEPKGAWMKKPFAPNMSQGSRSAPPGTQGDKKKRRAT